jgi:hypothetical protein
MLEGGDRTWHLRTAPAECDSVLLPSRAVIAIGGAKVAGVKPL